MVGRLTTNFLSRPLAQAFYPLLCASTLTTPAHAHTQQRISFHFIVPPNLQVVFDDSLHAFLESYLRDAPRPYDVDTVEGLPKDLGELEADLSRKVCRPVVKSASAPATNIYACALLALCFMPPFPQSTMPSLDSEPSIPSPGLSCPCADSHPTRVQGRLYVARGLCRAHLQCTAHL